MNGIKIRLDRDLNVSFNLNNLAVSSTVLASGDESSIEVNPIKFVNELGINHQIYTFE